MKKIFAWSTGNCIVALLVVFCFFVSFAPEKNVGAASDQVEETKESITELQKKIEKEEAKKAKLEQSLSSVQSSISSAQKVIQKTNTLILEAKKTIEQKEKELSRLDNQLKLERSILAGLIWKLYTNGETPLIQLVVSDRKFSDELGIADQLVDFQSKIQDVMDEIRNTQSLVEEEKSAIAETKEEHERLLDLKESQTQSLASNKNELVDEIEKREATIGELQGKLSKLRENLSDLLGSSYDASDIVEAAKFASKSTGVRKDFLMGMLVVESDLGRYTGGCYAKDSRMSGRRLELFKDICEELDYDWKKRKVSCPPKGYTGTGGAMGVAQFMSDTWMGYKKSIASGTGHNPPDPWNLTDGVMAMALKLGKVSGVTAHKRTGECNAAKLYLSGTTSSKYQWYCDKVLYWADNYERLLD